MKTNRTGSLSEADGKVDVDNNETCCQSAKNWCWRNIIHIVLLTMAVGAVGGAIIGSLDSCNSSLENITVTTEVVKCERDSERDDVQERDSECDCKSCHASLGIHFDGRFDEHGPGQKAGRRHVMLRHAMQYASQLIKILRERVITRHSSRALPGMLPSIVGPHRLLLLSTLGRTIRLLKVIVLTRQSLRLMRYCESLIRH